MTVLCGILRVKQAGLISHTSHQGQKTRPSLIDCFWLQIIEISFHRVGEGQFKVKGLWLNNVIQDTACFHLSCSAICSPDFMLRLVSIKIVVASHVDIRPPKEGKKKQQNKPNPHISLYRSLLSEATFPSITPPSAPFPLASLARIISHAHS